MKFDLKPFEDAIAKKGFSIQIEKGHKGVQAVIYKIESWSWGFPKSRIFCGQETAILDLWRYMSGLKFYDSELKRALWNAKKFAPPKGIEYFTPPPFPKEYNKVFEELERFKI